MGGEDEEDVQDSSHLWPAQGHGERCPVPRWEPLGMTESGQGRDGWKTMSHAPAVCSLLLLPALRCSYLS